jgi:hypothetical protein
VLLIALSTALPLPSFSAAKGVPHLTWSPRRRRGQPGDQASPPITLASWPFQVLLNRPTVHNATIQVCYPPACCSWSGNGIRQWFDRRFHQAILSASGLIVDSVNQVCVLAYGLVNHACILFEFEIDNFGATEKANRDP